MRVEKDFEEFIRLLNFQKVEYLIVGAYALIYYTYPRNTGDIDIFINSTHKNAEKMLNVIKDFGFESLGLEAEDFTKQDTIIQLGFPPNRIDIITGITGVLFSEAYGNKVEGEIGDEKVFFISEEDLIKNKKNTGRAKDIADVEILEKHLKLKKNK